MILRPISFAGKDLSNFGCAAGFVFGIQAGPSRNPVSVQRANAEPIVTGISQGVRTIPIEFTVEPGVEVAQGLMQILAAVQPNSAKRRTLIAEVGPVGGLPADFAMYGEQLEIEAWTGQYHYTGRNGVIIDFFTETDLWSERFDSVVEAVRFTASNQGMALLNQGGAPAIPTFKVSQLSPRASSTDEVGWLYRRVEVVTNSGTANWDRVRLTIDLGDTAAWVTASKALASGYDVRVVSGHFEFPRTLTNFNTKRTFVHFWASIPAGESQTFEIWYGNPNATNPGDISTRQGAADTYVADDLEGDSGTASGGGAGTLVDSTKTWEVNRWANGFVQAVAGLGSGKRRRILSNTVDTLTLERNWGGSNVDNTTVYVIWKSGVMANGGLATAIGTATTLTDSSQSFFTDELKGGALYNVTQGIGPFPIISNTPTVITISGTMAAPASSDVYYVERFGFLLWHVDKSVTETDHRGIWQAGKYHNKGALVRYGDQVPGGWVPWLMLPNNDDFSQGRYVDEGLAGGHAINNWPSFYARRAVRQDNTLPEEGQADGAAFFDPRGIHAFNWDYRMKNEGGIGVVEVRSQDDAGNDWETVASDSTTRASLTAVTSSGATGYALIGGSVRLWCGVLPFNGIEIPSTAKKSRTVELRANTKLMAWLDLTDCGGLTGGIYVVGAEQSGVWDVNLSLRLGGADLEPPYQTVEFGGVGHKLMLGSGQELWINMDPGAGAPMFGIYASDILVEAVPLAGEVYEWSTDLTGAISRNISPPELMPVVSGENLLGVSADRITGWTKTDGAGVTATLTNVTTPDWNGNAQAIRVNVTTAPVGPWTVELESAPIDLIPGTVYEFSQMCQRDGLTSDINVEMKAVYLSGGGSAIGNPDQDVDRDLTVEDIWYPMGWGDKMFAGSGASTATDGVIILITIRGDGATTGSVYFDQILFGTIPNLYVFESQMPTISLETSWRDRWFA